MEHTSPGMPNVNRPDRVSNSAPRPRQSARTWSLWPVGCGKGISRQLSLGWTIADIRTEVSDGSASPFSGLNPRSIMMKDAEALRTVCTSSHLRILPDLLPQLQTTFSARKKPVRWRRGRQAAAIEVVFQRKHDATILLCQGCQICHACSGPLPGIARRIFRARL
jgi:hypothetical protein